MEMALDHRHTVLGGYMVSRGPCALRAAAQVLLNISSARVCRAGILTPYTRPAAVCAERIAVGDSTGGHFNCRFRSSFMQRSCVQRAVHNVGARNRPSAPE